MAFRTDGRTLEWRGEGETLRVEPWGADSMRVRAAKKMPIAEINWGLLDEHHEPEGAIAVEIDDERGVATVSNGNIVVTAKAFREGNPGAGHTENLCELSFAKADGTVLFTEMPQSGALKLHARHYCPADGGSQMIEASFVASERERLYGMGEYQQNYMDLKGCSFELAHRNSQASIPFVVSSAGYGFLWNNPAIGTAEFAKNRTRWVAQSTRQLDYWVTAGDSPADIERHYADATGHAPAMPEWGLGFWQCKLRYWNQNQVLEVAREFKRREIPIDVLVIDFFHWPHMGDFRFEEEFWPDPKAMCDELHEMGIKVMVSVWPQIALKSENYEHMLENGLLVSAERGIDVANMYQEPNQFFDATNPEAREFVWGKCKSNYVDLGVDAFWLDEAEPEYGTYDFANYRYHSGPNVSTGNIYPREYNRAFYEGQLAEGREGEIVNLTRCAWVGAQRYGALVWSGDVHSTFADFKSQITCAIHMGMAGIPWFTTDMGGFALGDVNDPTFRELLARWCQFSCFSPVMRNHGYRLGAQPDGRMDEAIVAADGSQRDPSGVNNEPWTFGEDVERVFVKYINVREALRPYVRDLFAEASREGQPLIRGLFYEFPDDGRAADVADEYMFGPDLLVAPVVEMGARRRSVYLPGDASVRWAELHSGREFGGGELVDVDCPLDVVPVFARDGKDHGLLSLI
ncbi:family 31 glucosidase [Bifidobacterium lemurum]|uniref:Family 31 glucosidase n=1 Tax=Bifidobacterium lemurum TaxID=1603886 RepID=A0A261FQL9_9BIFI|nr:TIM-barrel domain-containing protein [Bifidobacterium lemurum]OZG61457.1 family 31 glucosidase [Bifidobacterium lemurum]QOL35120.1 glycoside hydrolase family 31 protein [Bifidobacterium lemurum]